MSDQEQYSWMDDVIVSLSGDQTTELHSGCEILKCLLWVLFFFRKKCQNYEKNAILPDCLLHRAAKSYKISQLEENKQEWLHPLVRWIVNLFAILLTFPMAEENTRLPAPNFVIAAAAAQMLSKSLATQRSQKKHPPRLEWSEVLLSLHSAFVGVDRQSDRDLYFIQRSGTFPPRSTHFLCESAEPMSVLLATDIDLS